MISMAYRNTRAIELRKDARRRTLLEAATWLFSRIGYHAATVPMIVAEANSSVGSFYTYFRNKEDVFATILEKLGEKIDVAIREAKESLSDPLLQMQIALEMAFLYLAKNPQEARILIVESSGLSHRLEQVRRAILWQQADECCKALLAKASLRSPMMLPRIALVDPELTYALPPAVTANTGPGALTQLIEPYVSARANPLTDALCVQGIALAAGALGRVYRDGMDREARQDMALASLFGGLALANAGLGVIHGFAAPLGGSWNAPHGALCAALLPHGMAANVARFASPRAAPSVAGTLRRPCVPADRPQGSNRGERRRMGAGALCRAQRSCAAHLGNRPSRFARRGGESSPRQLHAGQSASAHRRGVTGRGFGSVVSAVLGEQR